MLAGALAQPIPWAMPLPQWRWWPEQSPRMRGVVKGWKRMWQLARERLVAKAVTMGSLTSGTSATNATSYTTASITPTANNLVLAAITTRVSVGTPPDQPTASGGGMTTWTVVATRTSSEGGNNIRVTLFRALQASPGSGTLVFDFGAETQLSGCWSVAEFASVDTSGTNGAGAIVQSATNGVTGVKTITVTLAAFGSANNATYGAFCVNQGSTSVSPGVGFAEIHDQDAGATEHNHIETEWRATNDTTVDITWITYNADAVGIGIEIKAGGTAYTRSVAGNMPSATGIVTRAAGVFHRTVSGNQPAPSGAVGRKLSAFRSVAGSMPNPSGAVTRSHGRFRNVAGNMPAASGVVTRVYKAVRAVAGSMPAATGVVSRVYQAKRSVAGNMPAASGAVTRVYKAVRSVAGNMPAPSGAVVARFFHVILIRALYGPTLILKAISSPTLLVRGVSGATLKLQGLYNATLKLVGKVGATISLRGRRQ